MKNAIILILSIITLSINTNNNNSEAKMLNKFKKGFYFEKYKTAEEAKEQLLKLHPIGSDVDALIKTLEGAGAVNKKVITIKDIKLDKNNKKYFFKLYRRFIESNHYKFDSIKVSNDTYATNILEANIGIINPISWKINLWYNQNKKITDLSINKVYSGL